MQLQHPTPTKLSPTGQFSSRFVTAVLSGTDTGGIDVAAYQVSEQVCAMVDADLIEASVEPSVVRVKEEDRNLENPRYIPDVFFRYKNEYGRDVQKSAKPAFPVEYLLVNVTHGFPKSPDPLFKSSQWPIENRPGLEDASLEALFQELGQQGALNLTPTRIMMSPEDGETLSRWLSDWHLVTFIDTVGLLSKAELKVLMQAATASANERPTAIAQLVGTDGWQNLLAVARESIGPVRNTVPSGDVANSIPSQVLDASADEAAGPAAASDVRLCPHCTFENVHSGSDCEVCGLPLG